PGRSSDRADGLGRTGGGASQSRDPVAPPRERELATVHVRLGRRPGRRHARRRRRVEPDHRPGRPLRPRRAPDAGVPDPTAGGAATIVLSDDQPLDKMQAVGVKPTQGTFGIADARIISPGDPEGSVLFYRVAKLGGGRMPRVGSSAVDERAVAMLGDWIERM